MDVSWEPLYNHIDKPYCKEMRIKGEITGDEGDWWLTSRGVVRVNVSTLYGSQASLIDELEDKIARVVYPLLPLRIVSEGVLYILIYRIRERPETAFIDDVSIRHEMLEKWQEEDESVIPNGSYADVELAFPFSTVLYRMDSMRFDHYRLDTRVNQDVHEFARQSPSSATLEIGTNVKPIYYHMDSKPFDYHAIDYVPPRQFDVDSISHTDAAKQTLKVPDARDRMLGAEVESGEAPSVATEFALMSSLQDSEIEPIFTTPLRERSESIRVSAVLEGDGVAVMMASAEDRDLTTDDTIRQDSMSSDTWTPDREFPEQE
jgi:hypothetical protein